MPLVYSGLLEQYLLSNNALQNFTGGSKCKLDKKGCQLLFNRKPYLFFSALVIVFGISQAGPIFQLAFATGDKKIYRVVGATLGSGLLLVYWFAISYLKHMELVQTFFNNILKLERKHADYSERKPKIVQTAVLACKLIRFGGMRLIWVAIAVMSTGLPTLATNIFANAPALWILQGLKSCLPPFHPATWFIEKGLVLSGNSLFWAGPAKMSVLSSTETVIGSACFVVLTYQFEEKVRMVKTRNGMEQVAKFYRQMQILEGIFNSFESTQLVACLVASGLIQVSSALQVLKPPAIVAVDGSASSDLLVYWLITGYSADALCYVTIVINFLFGCCAQVHDTSVKCLGRLDRSGNMKRGSVSKKILRSLPVLKITFGATNYIEKLTPVVFQMYLLQRIVDALLVN